jgi:site-specific recombinase XerC
MIYRGDGDLQMVPQCSHLPEALRQYVHGARADNTWRTYRGQWRRFTHWCDQQGVAALPAEPQIVAAYLAERAQAGGAVASLSVTLAALRFAHTAAGLGSRLDSPVLTLVIDGIRRRHLRAQRQAEPLRGDLLRQVLCQTGRTPEDLRNAALLALLYVFGLRPSEATALDWQHPGQGRTWLRLLSDRGELILLGSKAAPSEVETIAIPTASNPLAFAAIARWIDHARIEVGAPVLRALARGGGIASSRLHVGSIGSIVKRAMARHFQRIGLPPEEARARAMRFSGHSGRVGLCVTASEAGVRLQHVAALTRHASLATAGRYAAQANQLQCAPHLTPGVGV